MPQERWPGGPATSQHSGPLRRPGARTTARHTQVWHWHAASVGRSEHGSGRMVGVQSHARWRRSATAFAATCCGRPIFCFLASLSMQLSDACTSTHQLHKACWAPPNQPRRICDASAFFFQHFCPPARVRRPEVCVSPVFRPGAKWLHAAQWQPARLRSRSEVEDVVEVWDLGLARMGLCGPSRPQRHAVNSPAPRKPGRSALGTDPAGAVAGRQLQLWVHDVFAPLGNPQGSSVMRRCSRAGEGQRRNERCITKGSATRLRTVDNEIQVAASVIGAHPCPRIFAHAGQQTGARTRQNVIAVPVVAAQPGGPQRLWRSGKGRRKMAGRGQLHVVGR